jgi:hypothetical protein
MKTMTMMRKTTRQMKNSNQLSKSRDAIRMRDESLVVTMILSL